ncbi:MAG: hypothetical protein U0457_14385 [Candidatus Sericytochromatia bacterium]
MTIGKALVIFIGVFVVTLSINIFVPKYKPPMEKENLESVLKNVKYNEEKPELKEINNILDVIPTRAILSFKNNVISSNLSKENEDKRRSEGEKILNQMNRNVDIGDLKLSFEDTSNETFKYLNMLLLPFLASALSGGIFFLLVKRSEDRNDQIDSLKGNVERLETVVQSYHAKETEFSRKIEKTIPTTLDECQKFIKNHLKEKENMLKNIEGLNTNLENSEKELKKQKEQLSNLESKNRENTSEINKLTYQINQAEDMKAKYDTIASDLKESNKKIKEFEKINVEELRNDISKLKSDLKESNQAKKSLEEKVEEFSKIDVDKIKNDNKTLKEEIKDLKEKLETANETLSNATTINYLKEKDETERLKKELEETSKKLESLMEGDNMSDSAKLKKDFFELEEKHKNLIAESEENQNKLQASLKLQESKNESLRDEFRNKAKELEQLRVELETANKKIKEMESLNLVESIEKEPDNS